MFMHMQHGIIKHLAQYARTTLLIPEVLQTEG